MEENMKAISILVFALFLVLVAGFGRAEMQGGMMGGSENKSEAMIHGGMMMDHDQMTGHMMGRMQQMAEMMGSMSEMMKHMPKGNASSMADMIQEMCGEMTQMSTMMKIGRASEEQMNQMSERMSEMKKRLSEMQNKE